MVGANGAIGDCLTTSLVFDCDSPGNTTDLLWENVDALGGDAAVAVVQATSLLLGGANQAVAARQVVGEEGGGASVGLGIGGAVSRNRGGLVLCQQGGLNNAVCWQSSTRDESSLHMS